MKLFNKNSQYSILKNCQITTPLVSVVMPVYNEIDNIERTIQYLKAQTLSDVEFILVDDGSTDGSLEKILDLVKGDTRFGVLAQKQLYAGVARNNGLLVSRGEFVIFLDADDYFDKDLLKKTYSKICLDRADILIFKYQRLNKVTNQLTKEGFNTALKYPLRPSEISKKIFQFTCPMPWNKLYRRQFLLENKIRFQPLAFANDLYFVFLSLALAKKITTLDEELMVYFVFSNGSLSASRDKQPLLFIKAYEQLRKSLLKSGVYDLYFISFCTSLNSSILWTFRVIKDKQKFYKELSEIHLLREIGIKYSMLFSDGQYVLKTEEFPKRYIEDTLKLKIKNKLLHKFGESSVVYKLLRSVYRVLESLNLVRF